VIDQLITSFLQSVGDDGGCSDTSIYFCDGRISYADIILPFGIK
jgi:hypothetical protein